MSNDPVGFKISNTMMFNRYAYGNGNPYKYSDPDGREAQDAWAAIGMAPPSNPVADRAAQIGANSSAGADFVDGIATDTVTDPLMYVGGIGLGVRGASLFGRLTLFFRKTDVPKKGPGSGLTNQTREQLLESGATYKDLVAEHQKKLSDYKADPWAHDNQGLLRYAPSDAIREKIISGRVIVLEGQLTKQQGELAKINKLLEE